MPTIEVALVGSREGAFTDNGRSDAAEMEKAWEDRETVEVEVTDDDTLGVVLRRAGEEFGIRGPGHETTAPVPVFVAFYDQDQPYELGRYETRVTVVNPEGHARWNAPFETVTLADIRRAIEAGVMPDSEGRLYYVTRPGIGNGVLATFLVMMGALKVFGDVLAMLEGTAGFTERIRQVARTRLAASKEAIEQHAEQWDARGADPTAIYGMLGDRPWHVADLAALLDSDEGAAGAILWAFGYAETSDGLWRKSADDTAQMIAPIFDEAQLSYSLGHDDFRSILTGRLAAYLATGERAPQPFIDGHQFGDQAAIPPEGEYVADEGLYGEDWDDLEPEDDLGGPSLPLDHLRIGCACGKAECSVLAGFGVANGALKVGFTGPTDHFVIDPEFIAAVGLQVAEQIHDAKPGTPIEPSS